MSLTARIMKVTSQVRPEPGSLACKILEEVSVWESSSCRVSTYPSTVVSEPHCPAHFFLDSEDARLPSRPLPRDLFFSFFFLKQTKYNISTILITLIVSCIYIFTPSQNLSPSLFPYSISNHWSSSPMNISVPLQTRPEPPRKIWEEEEQWEGDDTSTQEPDTKHPSGKSKPKKPDTEHPSGKSKSFKSSAHPWEHPSLLLEIKLSFLTKYPAAPNLLLL